MKLVIGGLISLFVYSTLLRFRSVVNLAVVRFVFRSCSRSWKLTLWISTFYRWVLFAEVVDTLNLSTQHEFWHCLSGLTLIAFANINRSCALRYTGWMQTGRLCINRRHFHIENDDGPCQFQSLPICTRFSLLLKRRYSRCKNPHANP